MREKLLDHEGEIELATRIEAGVLAREARLGGDLSTAEGELQALEERGRQAWLQMVNANLGLVGQVSSAMAARSNANAADLFQEGCLGLIEAVQRFDHRRGVRFSTYALHRIRAAVATAALTARSGPGLSAHRYREQRRLRRLANELSLRWGREPSSAEIAAADGQQRAVVEAILHVADAASLDGPEAVFTDPAQLAHTAGLGQDAATDRREWPAAELVDGLEASQAQVVRLRFGFDGGPARSRPAVAQLLGLSLGAVRRLESDALEELRGRVRCDARELLVS